MSPSECAFRRFCLVAEAAYLLEHLINPRHLPFYDPGTQADEDATNKEPTKYRAMVGSPPAVVTYIGEVRECLDRLYVNAGWEELSQLSEVGRYINVVKPDRFPPPEMARDLASRLEKLGKELLSEAKADYPQNFITPNCIEPALTQKTGNQCVRLAERLCGWVDGYLHPPAPYRAYAPGTPECLITLRQASAPISQSKRILAQYLNDGKIPPPTIGGGQGRANYWRYDDIRPALEKILGRSLPETFPADRFIRR